MHDIRDGLPTAALLKRAIYLRLLRRSLASADHVITVSDTIRDQVLSVGPQAQVTTIYNGVDPSRLASVKSEARDRCRSLALPIEFLLSVGHLESRKNYLTLIQALHQMRVSGRETHLVIVGNEGGDAQNISNQISSLGLSRQVKVLSGVSDRQLADLYALCTLVVFPSYYEGFGIPLLEAMAAQRPLVLSDIPVFRELTEGRGAYFPPQNSEAMAALIGDVLSNAERQEQLVAYGNERVQAFTFPRLATEVGQVYRHLVNQRGQNLE